jgi:hypothetical protein
LGKGRRGQGEPSERESRRNKLGWFHGVLVPILPLPREKLPGLVEAPQFR